MFRNIGSAFAHRFAMPRLVGPAIVAALVTSFAAFGCSSNSDSGTPDAAPTVCNLDQVEALFAAKSCTSSTCHASASESAALDLTANGLAARLVGKSPVANMGSIPSLCANMGKVYLTAGSNPATGLLLDKLTNTANCGSRMPLGLAALSASDISCVRTWATTVTTAP